jgi:hypothetical protein
MEPSSAKPTNPPPLVRVMAVPLRGRPSYLLQLNIGVLLSGIERCCRKAPRWS